MCLAKNLSATLLLATSVGVGHISESSAEHQHDVSGIEPQVEVFFISDVYRLHHDLDAADCGKLSFKEFGPSIVRFEERLFEFLRTEFAVETSVLSDSEVQALVDQALKDGERLGDTRQGSMLSLVTIHLLRPDIISDEWIWNQVLHQHPLSRNPNQRIGILVGYLIIDFASLEEHNAYFARLDRFWR